jgi:hypothetical protein
VLPSLVKLLPLKVWATAIPDEIDLHHHFGSPRWIKRVVEAKRQGWERFRDYTPDRAIESMDQGGTQTAPRRRSFLVPNRASGLAMISRKSDRKRSVSRAT